MCYNSQSNKYTNSKSRVKIDTTELSLILCCNTKK